MKIAFSSANITPPYPCILAGYERKSKSTGVLDNLYLKTCIWEINHETLIFIVVDCICITNDFATMIQKTLSSLYKIPYHHINVACIHTHSAPTFFALPTQVEIKEDIIWQEVIKRTILAQCESCMQHLIKAHIQYSETQIKDCYGNRNTKDGPCDKALQVLSFYHENELIGSILSIAVHPTILNASNLKITSDLLGNIRDEYEKQTKKDVMIWNGACGNVSTRFYRNKSNEQELRSCAKKIVEQIKPITFINMSEHISIDSFLLKTDYDFNKDQWANEKLKTLNQDDNQEASLYHRLINKQKMMNIHCELPCHIYLFDSIMIVTIPGEILAQASLYLKQRYPDYHVILIAYCNSYVSYIVPEEEYGKYFETYVSITPKNTFEILMDNITKHIDKLLL